MRTASPSFEILTDIVGLDILRSLEAIARICYKSEDKIGSIEKTNRFIGGLIKHGHESMLEHFSISVKFIVSRSLANELVRHRLASFAQESTRYVNYVEGITVIDPNDITWIQAERRENLFKEAERVYSSEIDEGIKPEIARDVLPLALKTEIVVTANLREWRHIFKLRALGTTGKPHPQLKSLMRDLLSFFKQRLPLIFDDLL